MKKEEMKFEDKMKILEQTINELESGEVDLEESIKKYTDAMKLVQDCDKQLKEIEEQVSKIVLEDGTEQDFSIEREENTLD